MEIKDVADELPRVGYSIDETARMFGVCRQTVYNAVNAGHLKTFKMGRRRLVSPEAARAYVRAQESQAWADV